MNKYIAALLLSSITAFSAKAAPAPFFSTLNQTQNSDVTFSSFDVNASDFTTGSSAEIITTGVFKFGNDDDEARTVYPAIYSNNNGVPGTLVGAFSSFTMPKNPNTIDYSIFTYANYTVTATGITLMPNTTYWMTVASNDVNDNDPVYWAANTGQGTDSGSTFTTVSATEIQYNTGSTVYGGTWGTSPGNGGSDDDMGNTLFSLSGTTPVPEPPAGLYLVAGFGALLFLRRFIPSVRK